MYIKLFTRSNDVWASRTFPPMSVYKSVIQSYGTGTIWDWASYVKNDDLFYEIDIFDNLIMLIQWTNKIPPCRLRTNKIPLCRLRRMLSSKRQLRLSSKRQLSYCWVSLPPKLANLQMYTNLEGDPWTNQLLLTQKSHH